MKIIEKKMDKTKAEKFKEAILEILDKDKAVELYSISDVAYFSNIAHKMNKDYDVRTQKIDGVGWQLWVKTYTGPYYTENYMFTEQDYQEIARLDEEREKKEKRKQARKKKQL